LGFLRIRGKRKGRIILDYPLFPKFIGDWVAKGLGLIGLGPGSKPLIKPTKNFFQTNLLRLNRKGFLGSFPKKKGLGRVLGGKGLVTRNYG